MSHSAFLHQVGDHDDDTNVLFPDHPPEVFRAGLQRTLSCDVGPGLVEALRTQRDHTKHPLGGFSFLLPGGEMMT